MKQSTKIMKYYEKPFILSRSKLTRLCEVIEKRFNKESLEFRRIFSVTLINSKNLILNNLNELFELDNGPKNEIKKLEILYSSTNGEYGVEISFIKKSVPQIEIMLSSPDYMWSNELVAEVEEQVERTLQSGFVWNLVSSRNFSIFLPLIGFFIASVFMTFFISDDKFFTPNEASINQLLDMAEVSNTTDKKIDFIYNYLKNSLPKENTQSISSNKVSFFMEWKFYLILVPLIVMVSILFYLFKYMYPKAIFEWGDIEEHYKTIVDRRKFLWSVVLISFIVGAFASLFATGVTSYIL
ncbi:hypothetical protein WAX74_14985 [Psychrobacillus sp. FJAT-51614]|uniref:Uncharacterized protein n=1 Tax=Psychrobacillus mangrovi TaxID=3117745 RepID=A0ABU8F7D7_9BACI